MLIVLKRQNVYSGIHLANAMLEQEIKSDIEERQKLMLQIKTLYLRYEFNERDEQLFLIYSIPAVYAIWEGFIQTALQTYIQELNKLKLTVDSFCKSILIYYLESKFPQFREYPKDYAKKELFFNKLNMFYTGKSVDISTSVNTESNVDFKVLNKILKEFNLELVEEYFEPGFSLKQKLKDFLIIRNAVAHGNGSTVNREDLENAIKLVHILMDLVLEKIIIGFASKSYLLTI